MRKILTLKGDKPECPYCGKTAELRKSRDVYPSCRQDYGLFWVCPGDCDAYVGTHSNSKNHAPLGRLADPELRKWKMLAHKAFDPLWKDDDNPRHMGFDRQQAYDWLTNQMGRTKQVHIGYCDVSDCRKIVEICSE